MKRPFILTLLLALTACIEVHDLGGYWEQGTTDAQLTGTWLQEEDTDPVAAVILVKHDRYRIEARDKRGQPILARTLKVGHYTYLMSDPAGHSEAVLIRYVLDHDRLELYQVRNVDGWVRQYHPEQTALQLGTPPRSIARMDAAIFDLLAEIPDEERYWSPEPGGRYRRLP